MKSVRRMITALIVAAMIGPIGSFASANLLFNPGAETGDVQGWTPAPENWWVAEGDEIAPHGGDFFFWPGNGDLPYGKLSQDVDISGRATEIDAGNLYLHLSGWMANWEQYPHDRATLAVEVLDAAGRQLLYLSREHRSPTWGQYQIDARVPAGGRTLRVLLIATRFVGTDNDGYFDDIQLTVDNAAPSVFVTIEPASGKTEAALGESLQLTAATAGGSDESYVWSSSFEAVATVDENGLVSTHRPGRVTIRAQGASTQVIGSIDLVVYGENDIVFKRPADGEKLVSGMYQNVVWNLKGAIDSATLQYSLSGGSEWTEIGEISNLSNNRYAWMAPDVETTENDCVLKFIWSGGEALSPSFKILPGRSPCVAGDANGDGTVGLIDVILNLRVIVDSK